MTPRIRSGPRATSPASRGAARNLGGIVVLLVAGVLGGCGSDGDEGDLEAFCAAVESLRDEDPFAELEIASPGEMQAAFGRLDAGVDAIESAAPSEARRQARAYQDSVDELIDQLRGAGFDPRNVDPLAYRQATAAYGNAAVSVDNAAANLCP